MRHRAGPDPGGSTPLVVALVPSRGLQCGTPWSILRVLSSLDRLSLIPLADAPPEKAALVLKEQTEDITGPCQLLVALGLAPGTCSGRSFLHWRGGVLELMHLLMLTSWNGDVDVMP